MISSAPSSRLNRALRSLEGLSLGDAFGEAMILTGSPDAPLPPAPWRWTDDTHMALSVVEVLRHGGAIDQDQLAQLFARRHQQEPWRGYAAGAAGMLTLMASGMAWHIATRAVFEDGSFGNGAAMRVAPVGAYFSDDLERAAHEATLSAEVTHAHPEGAAGAAAVAIAAAISGSSDPPIGAPFIERVLPFVPVSETRRRLEAACAIPPDRLAVAIRVLGNGGEVSCQDTVPFCIWSAAHHLYDFEHALWRTLEGAVDADTMCAIVGGIVAMSAPDLPGHWLERREPLPRT